MTQEPRKSVPGLPFYDKLGGRLAVLVALAMLPMALLGLAQSQSNAKQAAEQSQLAVMGETVRAAAPEIRLIGAAQIMAATLARTVQPFITDPAACSRMMATVAAQEPTISLLAYVPLSGLMVCASTARPYDFSNHPLFAKMSGLDRPGFVVNPDGPISGTSVLGVTHPVLDANGQRVGFISVSLPHLALTHAQFTEDTLTESHDPLALVTFDGTGTILTSSVGVAGAASRLPANRSLPSLATGQAQTFTAPSMAGQLRVFSVVPIADGLFLLGTWQANRTLTLFGADLDPYIFPMLMWLSAMGVALLATERLVTRHIQRLGLAMTSFSGSPRQQIDLDLAHGPSEIRTLGSAFEVMTATILREEAHLEDVLRQKEVLLREVHHRTGNSLQLIASIMRMHMRQEKSDDVRSILDGLHDRVMGLATVHMGLYQTSGQKDVQMDALFANVIRQITAMGPQKPSIQTELEPIHLIPDQAVPLSLLLTELLSGVSLQTAPEAGSIVVSLVGQGEGAARLRITGPALAGAQPSVEPTPTVIGTQLVRGFAEQIGGTLRVASTTDTVDIAIDFPIKDSNEP